MAAIFSRPLYRSVLSIANRIADMAAAAAVATSLMFATSVAQARDTIDRAVKSGRGKTLVTAMKVAGLVETLKGKRLFALFAPINKVIVKLPK